jgi:hypothetical protein
MIVWGGYDGYLGLFFNGGARYDPGADSWTPTSTGDGVPAPRQLHTAVWTGSEMIVWGGYDGSFFDTGGRYDPATVTWAPTSPGPGHPAARAAHTAVWTGRMIVWGGRYSDFSAYLNTGGRYDAATDTWLPTSTGSHVPTPRDSHSALWTGTHMLVWGGAPITGVTGVGLLCAPGCGEPTTIWHDADGDGSGDPAAPVPHQTCTVVPDGWQENAADCDDAAGSVYPGAPEICDGASNDCNAPG